MEPLEDFFERYRKGMEKMADLAELDSFFGLPWMVITPDGKTACHHSMEDLRNFTKTRFDSFAQDKLVRWTRRSYDAITIGAATTLVSINWEVSQADGPLTRAWRHYYMVVKTPQTWKIVMASFQPG